jgi:predicted alpha/beta-fold hydrolase
VSRRSSLDSYHVEAEEANIDRSTTQPILRFQPRPFRPAWWARGPHAQTLAGKLLRPEVTIALERERWPTPDGDFIDVDFTPEPPPPPGGALPEGAPLVVLLHGLEGSARRRYALLAYRELARHGIRAVGFNFRSCSGELNHTSRAYHSGETGDLALVLGRLADRFPGRRMGALGFSLGGNVLLKFLGEREADTHPLLAAAAVSVPFDLAAGADALEATPMGRFYALWFLRSLQRKVRGKSALLRELVQLDRVLAAETLRAFDDLATAPLHGFRDAAHYYELSSSARYLERVRTPTLLLQSLDDPFLPAGALPLRAIHGNPYFLPVLVERGGHVGFVEGSALSPRFWAEEEAARFLASRLFSQQET